VTKAEIKLNKIKSREHYHMNLLSEVLDPNVLHQRVPRLEEVAEARIAHKNKFNTIQKLGQLGTTGFNEDRSLQYIAQIDQAVWSAVVSVFSRYDPETGKLMDDGLLYKTDPVDGHVKLNRDFFFALLSGPLKNYDMRGKTSIMV